MTENITGATAAGVTAQSGTTEEQGTLGGAATPAVTTVTAHFKMVFLCVMSITLLCLFASLYIGVFVEKPTDGAKQAMDTCRTLANLGFGAMVGLLGGKAVN
ncbi:hypothetical protein ACWDO6_19575 [Streptomyces sp. NPDC003674]